MTGGLKRSIRLLLACHATNLQQARINAEFNQFKVKIDIPSYGPQVLHYAHQTSSRPDAIPLLFVQGWPGSFLEARKIIEPLTNPPDPSTQAFHVIVPSIPGFGPGDSPAKSGFGPVLTARGFKILMVDVLGYERFVTQGGDWGAMITRSMAMQYPQHVRACHHNFFPYVRNASFWTYRGANCAVAAVLHPGIRPPSPWAD